ncbi:TetR/AcrR family transcriptional regulator [Ichthyenterobacterium sp. W332]|uniref:TetR/AcrR family transcriptional regulator n=1 Tax=Microcosmobacter mediterraneus TaxID=3075607 RepID=A0ABU2YI75_9FLAO|nr:TetR/AcrR family transcriptional regulator [Ichthyenterobacterium sp. W332]MDT0557874.1 TetR/AcrR family transcriptional regulator [Ichthyenterobacterium sp. W332]
MREKILAIAADLFLSYGFKSVTMDDIANKIGISKKTIYLHFENKTKLVEATTLHLFDLISHGIDCICALEKNPIEEIYDIKRFVMDHLKDEKSSPQYQLQKYYPSIFTTLKTKQFSVMQDCVLENLKRGQKQGLYRKSIDIEFISRIYFSSMLAIKDKDLFPLKIFSMNMLMEHYLEYHLRGICTSQGLKILNQFINQPTEQQIKI